MNLIDLVLDIHARLDDAGIEHALSGALAFGYYGDPRGTLDADLLVFLPTSEAQRVVDLMAPTGFAPTGPIGDRLPISGVALVKAGATIHVDLFFAIDARYSEIAARRRIEPFGPGRVPVPILSVHDLVLFKLSFGRPKDWVDLQTLLASTTDIDDELVEDLLLDLRGPSMHPQIARFRRMLREARAQRS